MAPYSLRVPPQMAISGYMGKSETSYHTKIQKRSMDMKTPYTPATSRKMRAKNSFTRTSRSHMVQTPVKSTTAVSRIMGRLIPSTPLNQ